MSETTQDDSEANANWHPESRTTDSVDDLLTRVFAWGDAKNEIDNMTVALQAEIDNGGGYTREKEARDEQMAVLKVATEMMIQRDMLKFRKYGVDPAEESVNSWAQNWRFIIDAQKKNHFIDKSEYEIKCKAVDMVESMVTQAENNILDSEESSTPAENNIFETGQRRQEVAKNVEIAKEQALISEILRAAKSTAVIETTVMANSKLLYKDGEVTIENTGFDVFGDGVRYKRGYIENIEERGRGAFIPAEDSPEALIFEPATKTLYENVTIIEKKGLFGRKNEVAKKKKVGEQPITVLNPATGRQEPGVNVRYQFVGNGPGYRDYRIGKDDVALPRYTSPEKYGRSGNILEIEVTLPETVASALQRTALEDSGVIRRFAQAVVTENGATDASVKMPPYAELPPDWVIAVANMRSIDGRRTITSRQDVKI